MNEQRASDSIGRGLGLNERLGSLAARVGSLRSLPDDELLRRLSALMSRRVESELVAHIGEVDERRLYVGEACDSMFTYCTAVLHLSEREAYLRITVARAARAHPVLLTMLADGRLHLSGIAKLAAHLTEANRVALLERAMHGSKRETEMLVAELAPRPDVPPSIRKLPERSPGVEPAGGEVEPPSLEPAASPPERSTLELGPDRVASAPARDSERHAPVHPLAPSRYKVQFTASAEFCEKLERLKALMRSSVPDGDLARLLEDAVTEKLERLEARRFGRTRAPRRCLAKTDTSPSSRHIPAAVRRKVDERDGGQCRYVDGRGRRCAARARLEYHHVVPWARGGDRSVANIRLMLDPQRPSGRARLRHGVHGEVSTGIESGIRGATPAGGGRDAHERTGVEADLGAFTRLGRFRRAGWPGVPARRRAPARAWTSSCG